jgi:FkbM family methyltransferase
MKRFLSRIRGRITFLRELASQAGLFGACTLCIAAGWNRVIGRLFPGWRVLKIQVRPKGYSTAVAVRLNSSDMRVFEQVFVSQQYQPATTIDAPEVIVDCGANVGYASLFFLKHFPRARVIAVEPDARNAEMCRQNLRQYRDRVTIIEKAIWGRPAKLEFVQETRKAGGEWGIQVQEAMNGAADFVEAIDVPTLMKMARVKYIDLLKMDIETSETAVFQSNPEAWLPNVGNIAIELHGAECTRAFNRAMSQYSFRELSSGEVTVCFGVSPKTSVGVRA